MKGAFLRSVDLNDLYILPGLKFPTKNMMKNAYLRVYYLTMAQYRDSDKLLVQSFPESLTGAALAWLQKSKSKIKH